MCQVLDLVLVAKKELIRDEVMYAKSELDDNDKRCKMWHGDLCAV